MDECIRKGKEKQLIVLLTPFEKEKEGADMADEDGADEKEPVEMKTLDEMKADVREKIEKSYNDWFDNMDKDKRSDRFEASLMPLHTSTIRTQIFTILRRRQILT